jgi:hypothetical protein
MTSGTLSTPITATGGGLPGGSAGNCGTGGSDCCGWAAACAGGALGCGASAGAEWVTGGGGAACWLGGMK